PRVGGITARKLEFLIDENVRLVEIKIRATRGVDHFDQRAFTLVDEHVLVDVDFAFAASTVAVALLEQLDEQILDPDFGDRIKLATHRQRTLRVEREYAGQFADAARFAHPHLAVVFSFDVKDFASFDVFGLFESQVNGKWNYRAAVHDL